MEDLPAWLLRRSQDVLTRAREEIARRATTEEQGRLMSQALEATRLARTPGRYHASIHLPLLVYAGIQGHDEPAIPLAAACTLVWAGAELYDNLTDGDLPEPWKSGPPTDVIFTATAISCVLPPAIMADLPVPADRRLAMLRELSAGLLRMFEGQQRDLEFTDAEAPPPGEVEASVIGKNGAPKGFFAGLAAHMAGAPPEIRDAYMRFAVALGVIYQLQSDRYELFQASRCRDLEQGTRTLHLALYLDSTSGEEREEFLRLLHEARTSPEAQEEVRRRARRSDVVRSWTRVVRRHAETANAALATADPTEPAAAVLQGILRLRSPRCESAW